MTKAYFSEKLTRENLHDARRLVLMKEYRAINLAEALRLSIENPNYFEVRVKAAWIIYADALKHHVVACLLLSSTGVLLHSFVDDCDYSRAEACIKGLIPRRIHSILGFHRDTRYLTKVYRMRYKHVPHRFERYFLMCRSKEKELFLKPAYRCIRSKEADVPILLDVHIAYLQSEVIPKGKIIPLEWFEKNLRKLLYSQILYHCIDEKGRVLGKAGTNAQGFSWNQIGGVFTIPDERGKGVCASTVGAVIHTSQEENKSVALFVKRDNASAIRSYEKLQFSRVADFSIASFS